MTFRVSNHISVRVRRLIHHFREGTIGDRIAWEIQKWRQEITKSLDARRAEKKRKQWQKVEAQGGYLDFPVCRGAILRLYTDSRLSEIIYCWDFEAVERLFVQRYLRPSDIFVDVGANIGLFTVIAAKRVGDDGKVFAFEPAAIPRQRLEENVRLNRFTNVSVQPKALSNQTGTLAICVPSDGHDAWSSLGKPIAGMDLRNEDIEAISWDEFADKHKLAGNVNMMKIDVEGWETRVLKGAEEALSVLDAPLLQVEFTDKAAESSGNSCTELYRDLVNLGYSVCRYDAKRNELVPEGLRQSYPYVNLYATKNITADNQRLVLGKRAKGKVGKTIQEWLWPFS